MDEALLVFDGDCGFCTSTAHRVEARWTVPARAVARQRLPAGELGRLGLTPDDVERSAWWIDRSGARAGGPEAIGQALAAAGGWRRLTGRALLVPPLRWAGRAGYPLVARWRHRLPGGTPACRV